MMSPPDNVTVYNGINSDWWIDSDGVVCTISKPETEPITREKLNQNLELLRQLTGGQKICILTDITRARPGNNPREDQEYVIEEMKKIVRAMAVITGTPLGKMMMNLFFNLKPPPYPAKMFNNEQEAREWLKQYL